MTAAARLAVFALMFAGAAMAHSFEVGDLHIGHPWARATPPGAPAAAVYFTVESAEGTDRLIAVSTPVAEHAGMHRSIEKDGMATMKPVDSVPVSPEAPLEFAPGGYHVMLMGLRKPLVAGDRFPLTLRFRNAGEVTVEVVVEAMTFPGAGKHSHGR